jgi:hypothetical protein
MQPTLLLPAGCQVRCFSLDCGCENIVSHPLFVVDCMIMPTLLLLAECQAHTCNTIITFHSIVVVCASRFLLLCGRLSHHVVTEMSFNDLIDRMITVHVLGTTSSTTTLLLLPRGTVQPSPLPLLLPQKHTRIATQRTLTRTLDRQQEQEPRWNHHQCLAAASVLLRRRR